MVKLVKNTIHILTTYSTKDFQKMSSKRQVSSCLDNQIWTNIIKGRWKHISRIEECMKHIKTQLLQEEKILLQHIKDAPDYIKQKEKVTRLTYMIKHSEQTIDHELYMIKSASSLLTSSTC